MKKKCPVCQRSSDAFYCAECVRNGNFYHSSMKFPDRFAEKRLCECSLHMKILHMRDRAHLEVIRKNKKEILKKEIEDVKSRIFHLKKSIQSEKVAWRRTRQDTFLVENDILKLKGGIPKFTVKNKKMIENIVQYRRNISDRAVLIRDIEDDFKISAKIQFEHLTTDLFPVGKISNGASHDDNFETDQTVRDLTEAVQTIYMRGKWVKTSRFMQQQNYSILSMTLPGSGNYASFTRPNIGTEIDEKKEAQNICAGLTYLCQFVLLLANYLCVILPHEMVPSDFSDFTKQELNERRFQLLVSRLNANVIYLCVSQGVPPNLLHPLRAMPNIMALLNEEHPNLGRFGSFEFPDSIIEYLEEEGCLDLEYDSDSDSDWETVHHVPSAQFPVLPATGTYYHHRRSSFDETASDLVNSATETVLSLLKGIGMPQK